LAQAFCGLHPTPPSAQNQPPPATMERSSVHRRTGSSGRAERGGRRRSVLLTCAVAAMGTVIPARGFAGLSSRAGADVRGRSSPLAIADGRNRSPLVASWARGQRVRAEAAPLARVTSRPKQFLIPAGLGLILGATMILRLVVSVGAAILSLMGKPMLYLAEVALPSDSSQPRGTNPLVLLAGGAVALWGLSHVLRRVYKLCVLFVQFVGSQQKVLLVVLAFVAWVAVRRATRSLLD